MTIDLNRASLLSDLSLVRPAVSNQAFVPSLTHFLFTGYGVVGYNDISAIEVKADLDLNCCVPADLLIKSLNSLSGEKVAIDEGEGFIVISSGRSKVKIPTLPAEDFPFLIPHHEYKRGIEIDAGILSGIEKCLLGVGTDPTHVAQMGVTLEPGKSAVLYSTDNRSMSRYITESDINLPGDSPVVLPTFFCSQLLQLSKSFKGEEITLYFLSGSVSASIGDQAFLYTKLISDLEPLDFATIIRKHLNAEEFDKHPIPSGLDDAVSRAELITSSELDKLVNIEIKRKSMYVTSSSSLGETRDVLSTSADDFPTFTVDPQLLSRALKVCRDISFLDGVLVLFTEDFTHLIAHSREAK